MSPPSIEVFHTLELRERIVSCLEGKDLLRASAISKFTWSSIRNPVWQRQIGLLVGHEYAYEPNSLHDGRRTYAHLLHTIESITRRKHAASYERDIRHSTSIVDIVYRLSPRLTLVIRSINDNCDEIYLLEDGYLRLVCNSQPSMIIDSHCANGSLCMGWEKDKLVIRRVGNWSLVQHLETAADDGVDARPSKKWIAHNHYTLCLHRSGTSAGTIEVRDSQGLSKLFTLEHLGVIEYAPTNDLDRILTYSDYDVKLWNLKTHTCIAHFEAPRHRHIQTKGGIVAVTSGNDVRCYATDGNLLPCEIQGKFARRLLPHDKWLAFPDNTHLIGYEGQFYILGAHDGHEKGSFVTDNDAHVEIFLDCFIAGVTKTYLTIWSKSGCELVKQPRCHANVNSELVWDINGRIFLFYRGKIYDDCLEQYGVFDSSHLKDSV